MSDKKRYRVAILYDATTLHDVEAASPEEAADAAMDEAGSVSLCHQCVDEIEVGDPIRAAWVEDIDTGVCDHNVDPDYGALVAHSMLSRWAKLYRSLIESETMAQDEKGAALLVETDALLRLAGQ